MTGPFVTLLVDPPWQFTDHLTMSKVKRSAMSQYDTMSLDQLLALYQSPRVAKPMLNLPAGPAYIAGFPTADVGFCCMWSTAVNLLDGSAPALMRAWNYEPKQIVPWVKGNIQLSPSKIGLEHPDEPVLVTQIGMGWIYRNVAEYLIIGTRGRYSKLVKDHSEAGLILERRTKHSAKPNGQYVKIEQVLPGPYLELFARRRREGWTSWGNELDGEATQLANEPLPAPPVDWSWLHA